MTTNKQHQFKSDFNIATPIKLASNETYPLTEFIPATGSVEELALAAYLSSLADPSAKGKTLAMAAKNKIKKICLPNHYSLISASPNSNLSGINYKETKLREGTMESIEKWIRHVGGHIQSQVRQMVEQIKASGDQAIVIASQKIVLGIVIIKAR